MKKRVIALALCLVMLATCLGAGILAPTPVKLVDENGAAATSAAVPQLGRKTLTASYADATETTGYQWQFSNDGDTWIDIYGETAQTCSLSYAKVKNMLDADGEAQLRCVVTDGEDERVSSAATVTVDYSAPASQPAVQAKSAPARAASYARSASTMNAAAPKTYNVVINYVFADGEVVADPYTANLAAGSNFSTTVTFPTVQGYLPYVGVTQQNSIDLNYTAIDQNYTIDVVYKPTNVNYTVIHYQQNLNDDKYTEVERETTKQGLTNSTVPEVAKSYEGFYALLYEKPAIAADGSTVVEIYYDRYYYLMNFDLDGGYGVEPIYARFGAPISVGTPTKAGYSFGGWSLDGTTVVNLPEAMPAENRTYKAVWTVEGKAKVTIVVWGENADNEEYSYIKNGAYYANPDEMLTLDDLNDKQICGLNEHTHKSDCLSCTHYGSHSLTLSCYGLENAQPVDPNNYGDEDARTHFEDNCDRNKCKGLKQYLKDGSVCQYKDGSGSWPYDYDYYYFLYLNGQYYKITQEQYNSWKTTKGKSVDHGRDTYYVYGGKTDICTHVHTDGCYKCGLIEHTHSSSCYYNTNYMDSKLWKLVKSDEVIVAADGTTILNVYYDRTEFTLHFRNENSRNDTYGVIKDKWGADIQEKFKQKCTSAGTTNWSEKSNADSPWTSYLKVMPTEDKTYYANKDYSGTSTAYYYGESLSGGDELLYENVSTGTGFTVTEEEFIEFKGFTFDDSRSAKVGDYFSGAKFYYTRNSYTLSFYNYNEELKDNAKTVKYEAPLSGYNFEPSYPVGLEPNAYKFAGWYTTAGCYPGSEADLDSMTMPADNVLLYAKWVPVTHTVEFYLDKAALEAGTKLSSDITVSHGSKVDPIPETPENGSYTFIGWFYMENGVEKAFDFANMPVNKDMQVYGKWSSNVLKQYTIYYKIQGTDTEIAAPTTGSGLAGVTKTFDAKGGTDLYANYQEGYFPATKSHSLTLDINATEENDTNVFTFWYVQREAVPYTVKYLNKETGEPVATAKTVSDNRKAVVTETFVPVSGMMPDAYQKRLVVSAEDGAVNEIIFYYTEDTTHAYYKITHYTENLAKDNQGNTTWTEYASSQAVGDIGKTYNADPMTIPGFTYDNTVPGTVAGGELTADGLELKLYYTRNSYPYQVRYLEQGSGKQLTDPKNGTGKYGQVVFESAIDIANYAPVAPTSQTLNIRIEEGTEAKLNIITFYYKEKEVTINYQVVGPEGCGTVTPASETLKVLSGTAQGSTAEVSSDTYRFVGWYKDKECTQPVDSSWVVNNKLTPVKNADDAWTAATYYAKFEYNLTDLTITKIATPYDENDMFIFTVKHGDDVVAKVALTAGQSVTIKNLTVGETYTVTEDNNWSWRYIDVGDKTITLKPTGNEVTVNNTLEKNNWLGASSYAINQCINNTVKSLIDAFKSIVGN